MQFAGRAGDEAVEAGVGLVVFGEVNDAVARIDRGGFVFHLAHGQQRFGP